MELYRFSLSVVLVVCTLSIGTTQEKDVLEEFALSRDRSAVLAKLIPGTEDYYYYHVLHYQTVGRLDEAGKMVEQWIAQHGRSGRATQMLYRQMLLAYDRNPNPSLEFFIRELGLQLQHELPTAVRERGLPSQLDAQLLDEQKLIREAIANQGNLSQVTDRGLLLLDGNKLPISQLRELLGRFPYSTHPKLVDWVVRELSDKQTRGFGTLAVHQQLTLAQLDELQTRRPDLLGNQAFVTAKLLRLRPNADIDLPANSKEWLAYLGRVEQFTKTLPPAFISLRAAALYHLLEAQRQDGKYDRAVFLEYLKLPRTVRYIQPRLLERAQGQVAQLNADHSQLALLPMVGTDDALVRDYLERLLKDAAKPDEFKPYLEETYLQNIFVETKILFGIGDPLPWFNQLSADQQKQLRERVELDWSAANSRTWGLDGPVQLDVDVKNVDRLSVRVFRINLAAYYQQFDRPVNTDVDLDGLVAAVQWEQTFDQPAWQRHRETIELKGVDGRGVWVVDLVGGGRRSRALVVRGDVRVIEEASVSGHRFAVLDEQLRPVAGATLRVAGQEFTSDAQGQLTVPWIDQAKVQTAILVTGDFAKPVSFVHKAEGYALKGAFFIHREGLQAAKQTTLMVRASVLLGDRPASISLLESPVVTVTATDMDGSQMTQRFEKVELFEDRETEVTLRVPPRLRTLRFELSGKVQVASRDQTETLSTSDQFEFDTIHTTSTLYQAQLSETDAGYRLEVVGHTGEPAAALPVQIVASHVSVQQPITMTLAADAQGHIQLGKLAGIQSLAVSGNKLHAHEWMIASESVQWPKVIQAVAGEKMTLPTVPDELANVVLGFGRFQLVEFRGNAKTIDASANVKSSLGAIEIQGLTAGRYEIRDLATQQSCAFEVVAGREVGRQAIGEARTLETVARPISRIDSVRRDGKSIKVQIANASKFTRVHVLLSRYVSAIAPSSLEMPDIHPLLAAYRRPFSGYVSNLKLDDEYRYVLERQLAKKYPGNMLPQPTLLLNPWDIGESQAKEVQMAAGDAMPKAAAPAAAPSPSDPRGGLAGGAHGSGPKLPGDPLTVEYLKNSGRMLTNLIPTENGVIELDAEDLQDAQQITLMVVDPLTVQVRRVPLAPTELLRDDLRLARSLPGDKPYAQTRAVLTVNAGSPLEIGDVQSARAQIYSSLADLFQFYAAQVKDEKFSKFSFLPQWQQLKEEAKLAKVNEFACHELHLFLYFKDRPFFDKFIKPLLEQKKDPAFVDLWLLERDLSPFVALWRFKKLNAAERALLAVRMESQRAAVERSLNDWLKVHPIDPHLEQRRLMAALAGKDLDGESDFGLRVELSASLAMTDGSGYRAASDFAAAEPQSAAKESKPRGAEQLRKRSGGRESNADRFGYFEKRKLSELGDRELFRQLDTTKRWAESNYFRLTRAQTTAETVPVRGFWRDLTLPKDARPKISTDLLAPVANATEALLALAVIDLPLEAPKVESDAKDGKLVIRSSQTCVVITEQIREVKPKLENAATILIGQRISADNQPPIPGQATPAVKEFVAGEVYRSQIVLSNPSEQPVDTDVLLQIPAGSLPLEGMRATDSRRLRLEPYSTQQLAYAFYFPSAGQFPHYGATASASGTLLAAAPPMTLSVLAEPSGPDEGSWPYLVQKGTAEQLTTYLREKANLFHVDLESLAPRMQDAAVFKQVTAVLGELRLFQPTLWAYAFKHNDPLRMSEFLDQRADVVGQCAPTLQSRLLVVEPIERELYEHIEFRPLEVPRKHQAGGKWQIPNEELQQQWQALLRVIASVPKATDRQRLSLTYFLLLQQRIEEALEQLKEVDRGALGMQMAYDYLTAFTNFYRGRYDDADRLAAPYVEHPSQLWRERFAQVAQQVREHRAMVEGETIELPQSAEDPSRLVSTRDVRRDRGQTLAAALQPAFDLRIDGARAQFKWQNLEQIRVNYYVLDVELLFTRSPFVQNGSNRASLVEPTATKLLRLAAKQGEMPLEVPENLASQNVLLEVVAGNLRQSQVISGGDLAVQLATGYGQLQVSISGSTKPIIGSYVKVYAKTRDGQVKFWKDGYTDLRGRFDYASVSGQAVGEVERFSLLVIDGEHGALIRESEPPR